MKILNKLTIKHLLLNKKRTIVSIIGIMLSTSLMLGIGLICSTIREFLIDTTVSSAGRYHANINDVSTTKLDYIASNNNIDEYFYQYGLGYAYYEESNNDYKPYFYINYVSEGFFDDLVLLDGRYPQNENEILLSSHIFEQGEATYKVGDEITLEYGDRLIEDNDEDEIIEDTTTLYSYDESLEVKGKKTFKIVGICRRSFYEPYSSAGFFLFSLAPKKYEGEINLYLIYKNPRNAKKLSETIYKNLGKDLDESYGNAIDYNEGLLALYANSMYDNVNTFLITTLVIVLSIISVACAIVIYNSFAISVMERKREFGLFSSIGATKKQMAKTVLFEAFVVGSIGIILGIVAAYIGIGTLALVLNKILKNELGEFSFHLTTYPLFFVVPILFITITIIVSAFIPSLRASKISPIEAIRQNDDIKLKRRKVKTSKIIEKIFGIEASIALKNIKRNKRKYRIVLASLFISIVTFIAFSSYLKFGSETVEDYFITYDYDIEIQNKKNEDTSFIGELINHEDVSCYVKYKSLMVPIKRVSNKFYTDSYKNAFKERFNEEKFKYDAQYLTVITLDDNTYQEYLKRIGASKTDKILINYTKRINYNNGRVVVDSIVFKDNINFSLCNQSLLDEFLKNNENINSSTINDDDTLFQEYDKICSAKLDDFYMVKEDNYPTFLTNFEENDAILIVNEDDFEKIKNITALSDSYETVLVKATNFSELDKIGEKIKLYGGYYNNLTEMNKEDENLILMTKILLYGFIGLVTLIGVTSVFNTINTSINLRRREFAILRSVGLSPKGFNKMILFESLFFGIKSLLYGLPVGILLSFLISNSMNELVLSPFDLPLGSIAICIIGTFVIVLITMWYATVKIKGENILEEIRRENI